MFGNFGERLLREELVQQSHSLRVGGAAFAVLCIGDCFYRVQRHLSRLAADWIRTEEIRYRVP